MRFQVLQGTENRFLRYVFIFSKSQIGRIYYFTLQSTVRVMFYKSFALKIEIKKKKF